MGAPGPVEKEILADVAELLRDGTLVEPEIEPLCAARGHKDWWWTGSRWQCRLCHPPAVQSALPNF